MKGCRWQRILSVILSFAIVFNIAMVPAFAEGEDKAAEPAQEEEAAENSQDKGEEVQPEEKADDEEPQEEQSETSGSSAEPEEKAETGDSEIAKEPDEKEQEVEPEKHVGGEGKYVQDVMIAYGKTEEDAKAWLRKNGWEPLNGDADFNAGKASFFDNNKLQDQNVAAVMGIKRTDDPEDAITDMAVMNMKGGYSFPDYEALIKAKKTEIKEFLNSFQAVIDEFRENYNGKGSEYGKKRAEMAYTFLNKFYDGDPKSSEAVNDTGKKLGDLMLAKTMQEGNDKGADLEQIMLETSGPALLAVQTLLAVGADTGKESWLERAAGLTGDELKENLEKYVPEAKGQDVAPSAAGQFLKQHFGDHAKTLMEQWDAVHDDILWYEEYNEKNGLWQDDNEKDEAYDKRITEFFDKLQKSDADQYDEDYAKYSRLSTLYSGIYNTQYEGEWGETLGDFFNPAEDADFAGDVKNFLQLAAGLSEGQRASLDFVSMEMLLLMGLGDEKSLDQIKPDMKDVLKDDLEMDVYTGVNRNAFRNGVALTSAALMEQNMGRGQAFDQLWSNMGIVAIATYGAACVGAVTLITGAVMAAKGYRVTTSATSKEIFDLGDELAQAKREFERHMTQVELKIVKKDNQYLEAVQKAEQKLRNAQADKTEVTGSGVTGRWMLGIGGALLVGAAVVKGVQMYKYYKRDMTPIPLMIVDESDIVEYVTDEEGNAVTDESGNQQKNIAFDTYEYYTAVKCNRPEVGEIGDWQSGVKEYQDHGCYDVADLNADMGQEWLALYTVKSSNKGFPILADSLKLQYGSKDMPKGCTQALHMFTYTNPADLGDTAYAFNNEMNGVYFFWDHDEKADAQETASAFTGGTAAIAGGAAVLIAVIIAAVVMKKKRKEA